TCLRDAFPEIATRACAPGFAGWLCIDDLGCQAGRCDDWSDVGQRTQAFHTCAPKCTREEDCVPYDRGGNPSVISKFTCVHGVCRNLQTLLSVSTCLRDGDSCALAPAATCKGSVAASPAVDGGVDGGTSPSCGAIDVRTPLGALGGQA